MNFQIGTSCSSVAVEIPVRGKKVALIFADDQNFIHASLCVLEQGGTIGLVSRTEAVSVLAGELQGREYFADFDRLQSVETAYRMELKSFKKTNGQKATLHLYHRCKEVSVCMVSG